MTLLGKCAYALFLKVLSTPMSGISPEKKLVDKFLRQAHKLAYAESQSYYLYAKDTVEWTYRTRNCVRRPIEDGIAPFNELLDKSLHFNFLLD